MTLGQKIAALLIERRIKKTELAKKMGLKSSSVITHWAKDRHRPDRENIDKLAKIFAKPVEYFTDDEEMKETASTLRETPESEWVYLSIMGVVPAGAPTEAIEHYLGKYPVPREIVVGDPANYAMARGKGLSMIELGILDGDMLAYRKQEDANDGDVVIAMFDDGEVTCKKLRKKGGKCSLEGANAKMAPPPARPFRVIGKVVWRGGNPWRGQ